MSLIGLRVGLFGLVTSLACASGGGPANRPSTTRTEIRSLAIIPASPSACPGELITTRYVATATGGSRTTMDGGDVALLDRSGENVFARADGSWQADVNPLASAASGFQLHAALRSDSSVHADTVVAPTYGCVKRLIDLRAASAGGNTFIRLGVLRSPFHDSIVVASLEIGSGVSGVIVLGPRDLRNGVIRVDASGRPGAAGKGGRSGLAGAACERGQPGEDGDDGSPGGPGGRVDLIVQADAPWLADLVSISNQGGQGGAGGRGGTGGQSGAGSSSRSTASCPTGMARSGNAGRPGAAGSPGPVPRISTIPFPLLWTGSPHWNSDSMRGVLEQLIELTQR